MPSLTRAEALAQARAEYQAFVSNRTGSFPAAPDFVSELAEHWDRSLARLARLGPETPISREVTAALDFLAESIRREMEPDVALRWLDAFPDAVADLFPPSAITYMLTDEETPTPEAQVRTSRRQLVSAA